MTTTNKSVCSLGVKDLVLKEITKDDSTGVTYGTEVISAKGVKTIESTLIQETKDLEGDGDILATYTKNKGIDIKFTNAKVSTALFALINGATVTTADNKTTITTATTDKAKYFGMEYKDINTDGDATETHTAFYKVKGTLQKQYSEGDWTVCSFEGKAVKREYDSLLTADEFYDTATQTGGMLKNLPTT